MWLSLLGLKLDEVSGHGEGVQGVREVDWTTARDPAAGTKIGAGYGERTTEPQEEDRTTVRVTGVVALLNAESGKADLQAAKLVGSDNIGV